MDYKLATVEELADYVEVSSAQRISSILKYHTVRGNDEIVQKIMDARLVCKRRRLLKELESM